jgi:hypothetical protein
MSLSLALWGLTLPLEMWRSTVLLLDFLIDVMCFKEFGVLIKTKVCSYNCVVRGVFCKDLWCFNENIGDTFASKALQILLRWPGIIKMDPAVLLDGVNNLTNSESTNKIAFLK